MSIIISLSLLIIIGVPVIVYALINSAVKAKAEGNTSKQWFTLWVVGVLTLAILLLGFALLV
ncbi:MAG: hypothetical protein K0Q49_609 [Haloplasmataceae bacterium]|jgi:hypothetical protein|nr:hypothetical protein [Haloplasmataceae bacterium]